MTDQPQERMLNIKCKKSAVPYNWPLLLLSLSLLIDWPTCLELVHGNYLAPPNRTLPAELIVLDNGSTTFISSSLEEYLDQSTQTYPIGDSTPSPLSLKNITHQSLSIDSRPANKPQLEREFPVNRATIHHDRQDEGKNHPAGHRRQEDTRENLKERHTTTGSGGGTGVGRHGGHSGGNATGPKPIPQHWQVKSLLNVTHDYPLEYSQIICGYVWPLMAAITLFTNLMIVFVLTQRDMRTPTNVVLTAIAIADIIPIVVPVPWFVYLFAMDNEKQVLYPPIACYFYQHSTRSVSEIFYFLSTWLNVLLAVQDYLTACWPKLAKKYCQIKVVIIEIVALTLLAFLLNLPQALKLVFKPVQFYYKGQLTWGCRALQAKWFKDLVGEYVALYDDVFTAIIVVFVDGGPAVALITLTALLIRQLHRQRIQGHLLMEQARTASKRRRERHRQQEYEASARVMIFVLLAFLAVKIPFATTYTLMIIQSRFEIHFVENLVDFQKAITLTDLVFVLSYPINFTIFCGCSKKFRHKCAQLLGECNQNTKSAKNRLMSSFSSSFNSDNTTTISQMYGNNNNNNNNHNHHHQHTNCQPQIDHSDNYHNGHGGQKRDSLGTMLSAKRDSSVSLLLGADNNGTRTGNSITGYNSKRDSLIISGAILCCNGTANRKLSQPQQNLTSDRFSGDDDRSSRQDMMPLPIREDALEGSQESVRALADDGLCVECIMRYEQMKRSSGSLVANYHSNEQHQHQPQQQQRLSIDSGSSWQVSIPPPPPPLQFCLNQSSQQQQLPHIVTTRCESIRERSSSEEGNQDMAQAREHKCDLIAKIHPHTGDGSSQLGVAPSYSGSGISIDQQSDAAGVGSPKDPFSSRGRIKSYGFVGSSTRGSSDPGTVRGSMRKPSGGYDYRLDERYQERDVCSASHSNESISSAGLVEEEESGSRRSRNAKYLSGECKKGRHLRAPKLDQIENRHRSLSMSNSKLSALAGATGLLADIIKSTLLTTSPAASRSSASSLIDQQQQQQQQGKQSSLNREHH